MKWLWTWLYHMSRTQLNIQADTTNKAGNKAATGTDDPVLIRIRQRQQSLREDLDLVSQRRQRSV